MRENNHRLAQAGCIEVVIGSMFSGKTEELIRRVRRAQMAKQKVQVFKPGLDNRYSETHVTSHNAEKIESFVVKSAQDILTHLADTTRVVGIDEGQFFGPDVVDVAEKLANRGLRVVVAGLDTDWRGRPFSPMPELMAVAEYVTKLHAICVQCGSPACRTQRVTSDQADILVGSNDAYEARCRACFDISSVINEENISNKDPRPALNL